MHACSLSFNYLAKSNSPRVSKQSTLDSFINRGKDKWLSPSTIVINPALQLATNRIQASAETLVLDMEFNQSSIVPPPFYDNDYEGTLTCLSMCIHN